MFACVFVGDTRMVDDVNGLNSQRLSWVGWMPRARNCRQIILAADVWRFILALCEVVELSIVIELIFVIKISHLFEVDFVS